MGWLANLTGARGEDGALGVVEGQAAFVEGDPDEFEHTPRPGLGVLDQFFVLDLEDLDGQVTFPVCHKAVVLAEVRGEVREIVGVGRGLFAEAQK